MHQPLTVRDLGLMEYRACWALQEQVHTEVLNGGPATLLLVEHPPVITLGRRAGQMPHVLASPDLLKANGVDLVESDRGGDVTYHAPGQLVAYPILRLTDFGLSVSGYVHLLEDTVVQILAAMGVRSQRDADAVGVWTGGRKVCAIGVRVKRGVTLHGLAINVSTDLRGFDLIVPCGLAGRGVTSLRELLGADAPPMPELKQSLSAELAQRLLASKNSKRSG